MRGWIGVDLDGTLAKSVAAQTGEEIGAPIHPMVQLVKHWLAHGEDVRIFTARINPNHQKGDAVRVRRAVEAWCERYLGQILSVTYEKDWDMVLLLDDRARQVEHDTARVFCGHPRKDLKAYRYATIAAASSNTFNVQRTAANVIEQARGRVVIWGQRMGRRRATMRRLSN